jgi:hypothetical protein
VPSLPLQVCGFDLPSDPSRPVIYALSRVCAENWNAFVASVTESRALCDSSTKPQEAEMEQRIKTALGFIQNVTELLGWVYPNTSPLSVDVGMQTANLMKDLGFDDEDVHTMLKRIGRKRVGRPATGRGAAIKAKEMKLSDPRWTWPRITAELCDCGEDKHDIGCQDNLRREVLHLEKTLHKFGCSLP